MADKKPTNPEQVLRGLPIKQDPKAEPVVLAPHLPPMEKVDAVSTVAHDPVLLAMAMDQRPVIRSRLSG